MKFSHLFVAGLLLSLAGCRFFTSIEWYKTVPSTVFAFQNLENIPLAEALETSVLITLDELTGTSATEWRTMLEENQQAFRAYGVALIPVKRDEMKTIWWIEAEKGFLELVIDRYKKQGKHLSYDFLGFTMNKLSLNDNQFLYAVQTGKTIILSQSSFGVEEALRTSKEKLPPLLDDALFVPGGFYINSPQLGRLLAELSTIELAQRFEKLFDGLKPVHISSAGEVTNELWKLTGTIEKPASGSLLADWFMQPPFEVTLDRVIPLDAAAWAIYSDAPKLPPVDKNDTTSFFLSRNPETKQLLITGLKPEVGWAAFSASGQSSSGDEVFFRALADSDRVARGLHQLYEAALISKTEDGAWMISSAALGRLLGGPLFDHSNFFLRFAEGGMILSLRDALLRKFVDDQSRGRVLYYDDTYLSRRSGWPQEVSSVFGGNSARFFEFVSPSLNTKHRSDALFRQASDLLLVLVQHKSNVKLDLIGYPAGSGSLEAIAERWVFPLSTDDELTAQPVFIDLKGSPRKEILFATTQGRIVALATDGISVFEGSTSPDVPVGAPIVFDWYANGQKAVLVAAGSKIYGWSPDGKMLPKFPLKVGDAITAPLFAADVNRDRTNDIIVTTAERNVLVLNNRGIPLYGWPQKTNAPVYGMPLFAVKGNDRFVWTFSENVASAWLPDGSMAENLPVTLNAALYGSPVLFNDRILGAGADGHLYVIGAPLFPDSADALAAAGGAVKGTQAIYVSDTGLYATPKPVLIKRPLDDGTSVEIQSILLQSTGGTVYLLAMDGTTVFAQNMGQPSNEMQHPVLADLNGDGVPEVLALAEFGRLFAWNVLSQERLLDLPTAAMQLMNVTDFEDDGKTELVARTREGVRCWTISAN